MRAALRVCLTCLVLALFAQCSAVEVPTDRDGGARLIDAARGVRDAEPLRHDAGRDATSAL